MFDNLTQSTSAISSATVQQIRDRFTLIDAMHFIGRAWSDVSPITISNSFIKGRFRSPLNLQPQPELPIPEGMNKLMFTKFVKFDSDFPTCGELTDKEICESVKEDEKFDDTEINAWKPKVPVPTYTEAKEHLLKVRTYLENCDKGVDFSDFYRLEKIVESTAPKLKQSLYKFEELVIESTAHKLKQKQVDAFFSQNK